MDKYYGPLTAKTNELLDEERVKYDRLSDNIAYDMEQGKSCLLYTSHINSYRRKKLNGKSPYEAFSFYYGEDLAERLRCHEVAALSLIHI